MSDMTLSRVEDAVLKVEESTVDLKGLQPMFEGIGQRFDEVDNKFTSIPMIIIPSMPYVIFDGDKTGATDSTDKLIAANNAAVANKTYMVLLPSGDYWIKPGKLVVSENVEWVSMGNARLFTKETVPYNIIVSMRSGSKLTNLIFDQRQDVAMAPIRSDTNPKSLSIIHMPNLNDGTVQDCTFYACGVNAIIAQPQSAAVGFNINILRNKVIWQRKIETEFDATMLYIDGMSGSIRGNDIRAVKTSITNGWKFETGIEVHSPNMLVENNTVDGCVNGCIPTAWPGLWPLFDDAFRGCLRIINNNFLNCVRGISYWGAPVNSATTARNVFINDNYINLKLEKRPKSSYYYPTEGVGLGDHSSSTFAFSFKNIQIRGNRIETTYETGLNPRALMDYGPSPALQVGAFNLQTKYSCENIDISDNDVDFPLPVFNFKGIGTVVHKNIRVYNNRLWNPAVYHAYLSNGFDGVYNLENINGLDAGGNIIYGTPIMTRRDGVNVLNVKFRDN